MPTNINVSGAWKTLKQASVNVAGTWHNANVWVNVAGVWKQVSRPQIYLTISANVQNYNIYSAAGSPVGTPVDIFLTINSGVWVGSTGTGTPGMTTGAGWPAGSTIKIINNGTIAGMGGGGGRGGDFTSGQPRAGSAGAAGGNALNLQYSVTIDNTNGKIYGGGGGGGGGGASYDSQDATYTSYDTYAMGGGGGGGAGYNGGAGGSGGSDYAGTNASAGAAGSSSGPGGGSAGTVGGNAGAGAHGGSGGSGGTWGASGGGGSQGYSNFLSGTTYDPYGGSGGASGKAINLNGFTATFTAGNNSTQIKGAIS